jgi:hypothetical protein
MYEVETVPHSYIPLVHIVLSIDLYMAILLFVGSFDFRPSSQYMLVNIIPSCFRFMYMYLR